MNQQNPTSPRATDDDRVAVDDHVRVFDTTLRDGEQAPGFSMNRSQKIRLAHALEELGVDVIEAGFPQASPDDFAAVAQIAGELRRSTVCGLSRCLPGDIETTARALEKAKSARIHLFLSTSPLHREHKLGMSKQQVIDTAVDAVRRARALCDDVEFSAEDALRTEHDFLAEIFSAVLDAGAVTLNAPDTVGYTTPTEVAELFAWLRANVRGAERAVFSAHCHDDLGLAVANSLAAIGAGARQVECTINGIGERAGNAALEEIVMALRVRAPHYAVDTRIDARRLYPTSRLLSRLTGQALPRNKAVVGENAFAHESGIHQHGMLKHRGTYEIMRAEDVGVPPSRLVLGKHSGRHALRQRLEELGYTPDEDRLGVIFDAFKQLADRKREIHDGDLEALALGRDPDQPGPWRIEQLHAASHLRGGASASLKLRHDDGREVSEAAIGDGPVDAVVRAVERATGEALPLTDFRILSASEGGDAQGQAVLVVDREQRQWCGHGWSTDIVEAAALAALDVANAIARDHARQTRKTPAAKVVNA
ncbi:2-isopropylmalate synthase [Oleiagrimonas soli]|uniref:2-isopropylmalate synthase n=1 Tax=Oleiagrimonas soli TaxID=1543381 RepID=A0A099CUE7_9GAMM|nr:2-isopropylmalate synthase [Oleiagrimonas soli]KGI76620.1 2-isopropylmalate synthase [Oleiagrimonas soli]MBB6184941.1 2-isopropylmalate synthase [Oleiagrimonas soli]